MINFSDEFLELMNEISTDYSNALISFLDTLISTENENIVAIVIFGGIVRDRRLIANWSDIDLLIIYKNIAARNIKLIAAIKNDFESKYRIRFDLNEIGNAELTDSGILGIRYNSEYTNVLAFRHNVSILVYGVIDRSSLDLEREKETAVYYINNTINQYRRYLLENIDKQIDFRDIIIPRLVRWVFSIVRASLRLFGIYSHPYDESVTHLKRLMPSVDTILLEKLLRIRQGDSQLANESVLWEIDEFLTDYLKTLNGVIRCE